MGAPKYLLLRTLHCVFTNIDMKGGDPHECWIWKGRMNPNPVFQFRNQTLQVRRVVYSLKKGMHVDDVPKLSTTCGNPRCVNPNHSIPFASIAGIIASQHVSHAEAAKQADFLPKTKRGKQRVLTKMSVRGTYKKKKGAEPCI